MLLLELIPGPRGLGIVAGEHIKNLLKLTGLKERMDTDHMDQQILCHLRPKLFLVH